jgi:APA family basic amino acid/polyamine antiporter
VLIKVTISVFVIVAGVFYLKASNLTPFFPESKAQTSSSGGLAQPLWQAVTGVSPTAFGVAGVLTAAAVVFFAYSGFEAVANLGEETENPGRDMPRGLIGTLAICTVLYLLVCLVLTGMIDYRSIDESAPISDAFTQVGLDWASTLVSVAAVAGLTSVILVDLVAMGRIGFALCRDGLLPAAVGRVHPKYRTPFRLTIGTTIVVAVIGALVPITALAEMVSIGTLFAFVVVAIAVAVLRRTEPQMERPFKTPQVPLLPIVTALACVALMANLAVETWLRFLVWLVAGMAIYFFYGRTHARLAPGREEAVAKALGTDEVV